MVRAAAGRLTYTRLASGYIMVTGVLQLTMHESYSAIYTDDLKLSRYV